MTPHEMALAMVEVKPRQPGVLNQALQDRFMLSHKLASQVLGDLIRRDLIVVGWDGVLRPGSDA
jgi:hypothetical protein